MYKFGGKCIQGERNANGMLASEHIGHKAMAVLNVKSIALKWCFFTSASYTTYMEFSHIFMKNLGFSPQQIGFTSLFGVQHLFIPLLLVMADKFQARKVVIWITTVVAVVNSLLPLLPLVVPLPTCFERRVKNVDIAAQFNDPNASLNKRNASNLTGFSSLFPSKESLSNFSKINDIYYVPWTSNLYLLMIFSRAFNTYFEGVINPLNNLATLTYLDKERTSFGAYFMWVHIGTSLSVVTSALLAYILKISICGIEGYGYFVTFIIAAILQMLSMLGLPFFEYKYKIDRTISWADVKCVILNCHYMYMYVLTFYYGICVAFQAYWEFWYFDALDAGPLVMAFAALIRRPLLALFLFNSSYVIRRIGDLTPILMAFLLFTLSFFAISFTRVYWYVLALDTLQVAGHGLAYSAFTIHFSKAGTKASSAVILGLKEMCFMGGLDCGAVVFGVLFSYLGTQNAMLVWSAITALMLLGFLIYIVLSKRANEYEKLPLDSDDNHDDNDDNS